MNKDIGSYSVEGNAARQLKVSPQRRREIASLAARARWNKNKCVFTQDNPYWCATHKCAQVSCKTAGRFKY